MPRLRSLALVFVGIVLALFALLYALELANREAVKARLEALLSERTELIAQINGTVRWRYLWPTAITVTDVSARNEQGTEHWRVDSLRLDISTLSMLGAPREPDQWQVTGFQLQQLRGERGMLDSAVAEPDQITVNAFSITGLTPAQTAPFAATLSFREGANEPVDLALAGQLRFIAEERRLHFEPALVSGRCGDR